MLAVIILADVSDTIENPRRAGVSRRGRGRGAGRVSAPNWGFLGGGGPNIFLSGPKCPPSYGWETHIKFKILEAFESVASQGAQNVFKIAGAELWMDYPKRYPKKAH